MVDFQEHALGSERHRSRCCVQLSDGSQIGFSLPHKSVTTFFVDGSFFVCGRQQLLLLLALRVSEREKGTRILSAPSVSPPTIKRVLLRTTVCPDYSFLAY